MALFPNGFCCRLPATTKPHQTEKQLPTVLFQHHRKKHSGKYLRFARAVRFLLYIIAAINI
jgi:hypothetical protein